MRRLVPILAAIVLTPFLSVGQINITIDPPVFTLTGPNSATDLAYHVHINNNGTEAVSLFWIREVSGAPHEWLTWICDANLCYTPEVASCPLNKPNVVQPGGSIEFQMHMNPKKTDGTADYNVMVTDIDGNTLAMIDGEVCIPECATSTNNPSETKLTVFPNPAADYFQISELAGLRYVELYNIVGTRIRSFDAGPQKLYYVGDLNEGIYLVRLMTGSKKVLKTVRLSVR
jgi:hypothetical protein